jgi:hypothetical protein
MIRGALQNRVLGDATATRRDGQCWRCQLRKPRRDPIVAPIGRGPEPARSRHSATRSVRLLVPGEGLPDLE